MSKDRYDISISALTQEFGISKQSKVSMDKSVRLTHLGHGIYRAKHLVIGLNDMYAISVAVVGEGTYLRGSSVLYMLGFSPANPSTFHVKMPSRYNFQGAAEHAS